MHEPTYGSIQHLIEAEEQDRNTMKCVFKCPETGATAESSATISQGRGVKNVAKSAVKRSLFSSLRRAVSSTLYSTLGHSIAGRAASGVRSKGSPPSSSAFLRTCRSSWSMSGPSVINTDYCTVTHRRILHPLVLRIFVAHC